METNGHEAPEPPCLLSASNLKETFTAAVIVLGSRSEEESPENGPIVRSPKLPLTLESAVALDKRSPISMDKDESFDPLLSSVHGDKWVTSDCPTIEIEKDT